MCFADLKQAFNGVRLTALLSVLTKTGIARKITSTIKELNAEKYVYDNIKKK